MTYRCDGYEYEVERVAWDGVNRGHGEDALTDGWDGGSSAGLMSRHYLADDIVDREHRARIRAGHQRRREAVRS